MSAADFNCHANCNLQDEVKLSLGMNLIIMICILYRMVGQH
jgi:hypothetical protein